MQHNNTSFFSEFPSVSKADWLAKISKELKDKSLDDLQWKINETLEVNPFGHREDMSTPPAPLFSNNRTWKINEIIEANTPTAMNQQALQALSAGAESLTFIFEEMPDFSAFATCLEGIHLDYIDLQFGGEAVANNPSVFFFLLKKLAERNNLNTSDLKGALLYDLSQRTGLLDWRYLADLIDFQSENFPNFKIIEVDCSIFYKGNEGIVAELAQALAKGNTYLTKLSKFETSYTATNATIQFTFAVGTSYFLEIAKLRAFRLLWLQVLKAWNLPLESPKIQVHFAKEVYTEAVFTNMIRATSLAMSAIIGGADTLTVRNYAEGYENFTEYPPEFGRRIARNVQHLLKMESGFEQVGDVAAGSYYIENLTTQLAQAAWREFQK
jgi:methylmalonyl-CoA mutase